jgi:heme exporter protein C
MPMWLTSRVHKTVGSRTESDSVVEALQAVTALTVLGALVMVFLYAPREATMGDVQRIFYFHVASAWVGFVAFGVVFASSVGYLLRTNLEWDRLARASAEVGLTFITMAVLSGSLWARPVWGTFWTWDPRLSITAVQWTLYLAYVSLRGLIGGPERAARYAAVYGIMAFVTVPLSWFAIRWWRTIHPQILSSGDMGMTPRMLQTLIVSVVAFSLLYLSLLSARVRLVRSEDRLAQLRETVWDLAAQALPARSPIEGEEV